MTEFVDFSEAKRVISVTDVIQACKLSLDQLTIKDSSISGQCMLPSHVHNQVRPNLQQFKADCKKGYWLWKCFSPECNQGGDSIALAKALTGLSDQHIRHWLLENFGSRLTRTKPKRGSSETARKKASEHDPRPRNSSSPTQTTVSAILPPRPAAVNPLSWSYTLEPDCDYLLKTRHLKPETIARFGLGLRQGGGWLENFIAIPLLWHDQPEADKPIAELAQLETPLHPISYLGRYCGERETWDPPQPKYKFWKDFPRRLYVYGLREALSENPKGLAIVEGPFYLYRCYEAGLPTVSTLGAGMSDEQAAVLAATKLELCLLYDGDAQEAQRAAASKLALAGALCVRQVSLDKGVEPDDLSPEELRTILSFLC